MWSQKRSKEWGGGDCRRLATPLVDGPYATPPIIQERPEIQTLYEVYLFFTSSN